MAAGMVWCLGAEMLGCCLPGGTEFGCTLGAECWDGRFCAAWGDRVGAGCWGWARFLPPGCWGPWAWALLAARLCGLVWGLDCGLFGTGFWCGALEGGGRFLVGASCKNRKGHRFCCTVGLDWKRMELYDSD